MKIYKISHDLNKDYDTYDGAIVAAENEDEARNMHPSGRLEVRSEIKLRYDDWVSPDLVKVTYIGETTEPRGVILASFNAG